jgi:hypothetical protein
VYFTIHLCYFELPVMTSPRWQPQVKILLLIYRIIGDIETWFWCLYPYFRVTEIDGIIINLTVWLIKPAILKFILCLIIYFGVLLDTIGWIVVSIPTIPLYLEQGQSSNKTMIIMLKAGIFTILTVILNSKIAAYQYRAFVIPPSTRYMSVSIHNHVLNVNEFKIYKNIIFIHLEKL